MPRVRSSIVLVETTIPSTHATRTAAAIVEERLAACANWAPLRSLYWWKGKRETAREVLLSFKTTRSRSSALVRRLKRLHPYDVPYIAQYPVRVREEAYAQWVLAETRARERKR